MAGPTAEEMLQFIQGSSGNVPAAPSITVPQEDSGMPSSEDMLKFIQKTSPSVEIKQETDVLPEDDEKYVEYYTKRMLPVPDNAVPFYDYSKDTLPQQSEVEKVRREYAETEKYFDELSEEELAEVSDQIRRDMLNLDEQGNEKDLSGMQRRAGLIENLLSRADPKTLVAIGKAVDLIGAYTDDKVTAGLTLLQDNVPVLYDAINSGVAGGRYAKSDDPRELSGEILSSFGTATEFGETIPAIGGLFSPLAASRSVKKVGKEVERNNRRLKIAQRYNPEGAKLATMETAEEARIAAKKVADSEVELSNQMIVEFETKIGGRDVDGTIIDDSKIISTETNGVLKVDADKSREVGRQTAQEITERDGALFDLALGEDVITSPILNPDKFNGLVAAAKELKELKPDAFNNKKTVIDNLLDLSISKDFEADIGGQNLVDILNKYGLSFEDYVLTVVGSGSDAGKVLNALSQIKRKKPQNVIDADDAKKKAREAGDLRKGVMRIENIRRGGLVSQIATAARNLTSGAIRAPLESLGNVMDTAIYTAQNKGTVAGIGSLLSRDNWSGSFSNMKYMFSRPDVAKGYADLILERPEMAKQFDAMYNNINEIQKLTGRGSGTKVDKVLSGMEDVVDVLNTPNRWQEFLIRRGQFFGELERLTKRHYGIDLIDALNDGKLKDLMNDASSIRPEGSPSFIKLVDDAATKALDVTYAKQPEIPLFREMSAFITRNGLTVAVPFPRFMFNSMELMGQYAAGASIPMTRKVKDLVTLSNSGPLTSKDRQRITRNLMGMAAVGSAYWYRSSDQAPAEYNQIAVGSDAQMDSTPTYPMAHFLYLGEATKRLKDGTFDDWFDSQEFVELFTGSNFRTGVGNSILEEVALIADGTDLTAKEAAGRAAGRTLGNYLTTWAVPFAQVIDVERALGVRGDEYKDVSKDPNLNMVDTFGNEIKRSFQQRGFGLSAAEEAELPMQEYPFYPDGKQRISPAFKFAGVSLTSRPSETGEYLMSLGFDYRDFGSKSKVPTIKRFEQQMINGHMDTLVDMAQAQESKLRKQYEAAPQVLRDEFTEEEYVANKLRPLISEQLSSFKQKIREGAIAQGDSYARAMLAYRKIQPQFRKLATTDFIERYGKAPDPASADDLKRLTKIAEVYKEAY
jgi:hypothetical protein